MRPQDAFEKRIKKFLIEQPDSSATATILKIKNCLPKSGSYYNLFDDFCNRLGFGFVNDELVNEKNDKTIGFYPLIKYYPNNILNEPAGEKQLVNVNSPVNEKLSYEILAKQVVYRIMEIPNLDEVIANLKTIGRL